MGFRYVPTAKNLSFVSSNFCVYAKSSFFNGSCITAFLSLQDAKNMAKILIKIAFFIDNPFSIIITYLSIIL
ncbi:hypothetical protein CFV33872_01105 [Campylobacter fetus subsp. venerealis CCUG 33872]|nr:hypothetical protein KU70_02300 [Campylobacter fetus]OCS18629.1 hypothetical protein CFFBT1098_05940 [Campylobacter fetus subsp. fetus BT 10/98]OCS20931.1 hypothetical protein CFVI03596_02920 [Campylobacter fetus subsp. venerealis cfvi03/596]OCS22531.1 hypothetical protein CFVI97532_04450 [Campylobacter fetus subsp. venerealis cfvi97/532]OCS25711.1 hypothetical protein CFVB10_07050 [Campylobacter fetus subsp. venerealis cfvB10]OCS28908.1 hypothetical protein CFV33872_01105 [Campylobacter fe